MSSIAKTSPLSEGALQDLRVQTDEGRQTPRRTSFATVLARGVQTALLAGANLLGPAAPAGIALAASVGAAAGGATTGTGLGGAAGTGLAGALGAGGAPTEAQLLQQQEAMRQQDRVFNLQYLDLQRKVQEDQRQFQVMTNLLKTEHETVKTAINNLR
jgi:hypothetical protein